jgi:HAD superfamily hydrolase (TIGR01490 family)
LIAPQIEKPVVAAFDFDGTLTRRDTLLPFLVSALGAPTVVGNALMLAPVLAGYALGLTGNGVAKEKVFIRCFAGMQIAVLRQKAARFVDHVLPGLIRPEAMRRLEWHKKRGHRCVVISASLELYVLPWARKAGFDDVIATRLETAADGRVSGKLSGENCYGHEKVTRLESLLGARNRYTLYAYGDSAGDKELLAYSDFPYFRQMPEDKL